MIFNIFGLKYIAKREAIMARILLFYSEKGVDEIPEHAFSIVFDYPRKYKSERDLIKSLPCPEDWFDYKKDLTLVFDQG